MKNFVVDGALRFLLLGRRALFAWYPCMRYADHEGPRSSLAHRHHSRVSHFYEYVLSNHPLSCLHYSYCSE